MDLDEKLKEIIINCFDEITEDDFNASDVMIDLNDMIEVDIDRNGLSIRKTFYSFLDSMYLTGYYPSNKYLQFRLEKINDDILESARDGIYNDYKKELNSIGIKKPTDKYLNWDYLHENELGFIAEELDSYFMNEMRDFGLCTEIIAYIDKSKDDVRTVHFKIDIVDSNGMSLFYYSDSKEEDKEYDVLSYEFTDDMSYEEIYGIVEDITLQLVKQW